MSADFTPTQPNFKNLVFMNIQQLTNFPYIEDDFDALTNYGLLCKVVDYLNEVISNNNQQNETITGLYNAYVSLQNYVNDYFDNLDVQEEINNKLDEMAADGSLTALIKNYVDPIYEAYENTINTQVSNYEQSINNTVDAQNTLIGQINNKVNSVASGSPLVASSTAGMTDTNKTYVNTTDGNWYYYDGDSWEIGGVYQSTGIADNSVSFESLSTLMKDDLINRTTISDLLDYEDYTIEDLSIYEFTNHNVNGTTGEQETATSNQVISNNDLIYIPPKTKLTLNILNDYSLPNYNVFLYNSDKSYIGQCVNYNLIEPTYFDKGCYIRLGLKKSGILATDISNFTLTLSKSKVYSKNIKYINENTNLINPETLNINKFINTATHKLDNGTSYNTTDFIPIEQATYITLMRIRMYDLYDAQKFYIPGAVTQNVAAESQIVISNAKAKYIRISYYKADTNIMFYKGDEVIDYQPYKKVLEESAALSTMMKKEVSDMVSDVNTSNVLYGKKLVTCGDSFTQYTNATFDGGIYDGYNKVWPYLIGLRNNMTVHNMAVSGGTMATGDFTAANKFSAGLYQEIDADADYIILKYGINDNNNNVPVGTITDSETTTFYGAWNTVMSYIIEHHPTAKIGIIVTNGLELNTEQTNNSEYATAIINIAKKYGIPTLNEWNDPNVPLLIRTGRTDVAESIRNIRAETFRVSSVNTHENYVCHAYESTFIEDFLRRL